MEQECIENKCKGCHKQRVCFGVCQEHNFIEVNHSSLYITYKCTYCGYREVRKRTVKADGEI